MENKILMTMRHGKAEAGQGKKDHDRCLMPRGIKQAREAALAMAAQNRIPDLIISSSAVRARETAEVIIDTLPGNIPLQLEDELYLCSVEELISTAKICPDEIDSLLLVGHNPTMEFLQERISGGYHSVKTSEVYAYRLHQSRWMDIHVDSLENMGEVYTH